MLINTSLLFLKDFVFWVGWAYDGYLTMFIVSNAIYEDIVHFTTDLVKILNLNYL